MRDLKDNVAVITGGSEGLGLEVALKLAKEGAKVVLIARNEQKLKDAATIIKAAGGEVETHACDVSDSSNVNSVMDSVLKKYGTVDILVNDAGIWFEGPVEEHPAEKVKELFEINAVGPIYMTQAVLPTMKANRSGQIFNVSSIAGVLAEPGWPVYVGTKFALRGFTEALEAELAGTGIRVMGFYPGGINTDLFTKSGFPRKDEPWMMKTANVADVVLFMLKQPKDMLIDHIVVKSMNDNLLFEE